MQDGVQASMIGELSFSAAHSQDLHCNRGIKTMAAPEGLKVGDTYLEGNLVYEVTKVGGQYRYEAKWTGETSSAKLPVKEPVKEVKEEKAEAVDYSAMAYADLKKLCASKGIDAKGSKSDLIARLEK